MLSLRFVRTTVLLQIVIIACLIGRTVHAKAEMLKQRIISYSISSGKHQVTENVEALVSRQEIKIQDVPWIRVHFKEVNLGANSYLIITSLKDRSRQTLNVKTIREWNYFSAYFNGDAVRVELFAGRDDTGIYFEVGHVVVGEWDQYDGPASVCGTDDRVTSNNPSIGYIVGQGTAWIVVSGKLVTAGHVLSGATSSYVVQFNSPAELSNGQVQFSEASDQYAIDINSRNYHGYPGVVPGDDWGTFDVFANPTTNKKPFEAQGTYIQVSQDLTGSSVRVTGYAGSSTQRTAIASGATISGIVA